MSGVSLDNRFKMLVVVIAAVIWFSLLGHRDLIEPDEGRYAEIPREMLVTGDWVTPRLNGFKYFEKPAFQYWMTALSYKLFGLSNASARLWTALFGFLCGFFIWYLGARLFDAQTGFYAFVFSLSGLLYVGLSHILTLDLTVSVFMVLGVGSLALAQSNRTESLWVRNWMLLAWAALAGAVLTKGLIGIVLPGGAVVLYSLWQRDWALWRHMHLGKGLGLFLLLTVPWFLMVSQANDDFARFFFIHEHFDRYTTTVHSRKGPVYYFVPVFMLGVSPWLVSSLRGLLKPGFTWRPTPREGFNAERFLWVFVVLTFVFFSIGQSKLPAYILPIMPVVALLAGRRLSLAPNVKADAWVMLALGGLFLSVGILATHLASSKIPEELYRQYRVWIVLGSAALLIGSGVLFRAPRSPHKHIAVAGLFALLGFQLFIWGFQNISPSRSSRELAQAIIEDGLQDAPVYSVETSYPQSLPFYLNKTIHLVGYKGELEMGIDAEPRLWIETPEAFIAHWEAEDQAVAVFSPDGYARYAERGLEMRTLYQGPRRIAVAKK